MLRDVLTALLNVCVSVYAAVCVCAVTKRIELLSFSTKPFVCVCVCVCTCMCKYLGAGMGQEAALSCMDLLLKFEQF